MSKRNVSLFFLGALALLLVFSGCEVPTSEGPTKVLPPAKPANFGATAGVAEVDLSWDLVEGSTSYKVYWSKDPTMAAGNVQTVAGLKQASYRHEFLDVGATYYYEVSAVNAGGESPRSARTSASLPFVVPAAPTGLSAVAGEGSVELDWDPVPGAGAYKVYWSYVEAMDETNWRVFQDVGATSFTHSGLEAAGTFFYRVSAVNAAGESALSTQVSATTPEATK